VANIILNFEEKFNHSDFASKKLLLKKCIYGATVDREKNVFRLDVRQVPMATIDLEFLLQKEKAATKVVTAMSSGGTRRT
jgi:hypothetical protein